MRRRLASTVSLLTIGGLLAPVTAYASDRTAAPVTGTAAPAAFMSEVPTTTKEASAPSRRPAFQLPFRCRQVWTGDSNDSSVHVSYEIDFNRGASAESDNGQPVLAAAGGTVSHAGRLAGTGHGELVIIEHRGPYRTFYAHLKGFRVSVGDSVRRGEMIGRVGKTSRPGSGISSHLHYEVRTGSGQSSIVPAYFNGRRFGYTRDQVRSRNCAGNAANPYTPKDVCGPNYDIIDRRRLGQEGRRAGTIYLMWNGALGKNCVVTLKARNFERTLTGAFLEPRGGKRAVDRGQFKYFAGPLKREARNRCVKWGGRIGSHTYSSPFEHCG